MQAAAWTEADRAAKHNTWPPSYDHGGAARLTVRHLTVQLLTAD